MHLLYTNIFQHFDAETLQMWYKLLFFSPSVLTKIFELFFPLYIICKDMQKVHSLYVSDACFSAQCVLDGSHAHGVSCFSSQAYCRNRLCLSVCLPFFFSLSQSSFFLLTSETLRHFSWAILLTYFTVNVSMYLEHILLRNKFVEHIISQLQGSCHYWNLKTWNQKSKSSS